MWLALHVYLEGLSIGEGRQVKRILPLQNDIEGREKVIFFTF